MILSLYRLLYQITPIWLTNGIAAPISGGMLPLIALTDPNAFTAIFQSGNASFNMDDAFGIFQPIPGGSLVNQAIAEYPFANLNVASNAIVRNPIDVSLIMMTPMKTTQAWSTKLSTMTMLKNTLDNHNNAGGSYTVFTPAWTYVNMLMKTLVDVSTAQSPLPQNTWRWDFHKPLISIADILAAESNLFTKITNGVPSTTEWTGAPTTIGNIANYYNFGTGAGGSVPPLSPPAFSP